MKITSCVASLLTTVAGLCHICAQSFTNGDFEAGNLGFSSDYEFADFNVAEGQFTVRSDPQNWNLEFAYFGDHTTGAGQMLVVNGATAGDPAIWRQIVALDPNTPYCFQVWAGSAVGGGPANLMLRIDGTQIGTPFALPNQTGVWALWEQPWTSLTSGAHTFEIINLNTSRYPNDFYIDDVRLIHAFPELTARVNGSELVLTWPVDSAWGLFSSDTMITGSWKLVERIPVTNGNLAILRLSTGLPQAFFRLQRLP